MHNPFEALLAQSERRAVVLDGGFATELERQGHDLSQDHLWSARTLADDPEAVRRVHAAYFDAGADVATTCSYQASFEGYARAGLSASAAAELLRRSVQMADQARTERLHKLQQSRQGGMRRPLVAFSCGPYGATLADGSEYDGSYAEKVTVEELMDFHRQRLQAVVHESAIDVLAFETIPCAKELHAIEQLLRTEGSPAPAWVSVSCRDGTHTSHGEDYAATCLPLLAGCEQIVAVGFNCTAPRHVTPLLEKARHALEVMQNSKLLLTYPNSGEGFVSAQGGWDGQPDLSAQQFGAASKEWAASGASLIGGCCRTTPEHIHHVAMNLL